MTSFGKKPFPLFSDDGGAAALSDSVSPLVFTGFVTAPAGADSFPLADSSAGSVNQLSAGSVKPVATIPQLADYLVNGFWQFNSTIAHHWASSTITYNITGLTVAEQFLAQSALEAWHEVANVSFVQTSGAANITFNHNGSMTAFESDNYTNSGVMISSTVDISADWITSDGGAMDGKTGIDSYGYQTYIHEIGHALGLGHQGPYNGNAVYSSDATYADDTWQYSVMSYFSENNFSGSSYRYVVTPQMADIYAVDSIYGAAATRSGNTVYGFHSTAGSIYDFNAYSQAPALTIYDTGGNDTLDCSGYSVAQTIDLHPGSFSSVGGVVHNIGISTTTVIENAIGGSGNDTLIANDLGCTLTGGAGNDTLIGGAGNDRLIGGAGVDTLTGGGGADTFVFAFGDSSAATGQHDLITDFASGVDHIDLSGIDAVSSTGALDAFHFIGAAGFDGAAGELDYVFDGAHGVTLLEGDTNGDRIADFIINLSGNIAISASDLIGAFAVPVVIESSGSTSLVQVGGNYFLDAIGSGTGPELKYLGAPVVAGQAAPWSPFAVEQTAGGYDVAWHQAGADQYSVWSTDSSGNFLSNLTGAVSGTSSAFEAFEAIFHQDLNGDGINGVVGSPALVTVEAMGSTSLVTLGNGYSLNSNATGTGPELKYGGASVVVGQAAPWSPIGAEQTAGGYDVAWHQAGADQYSVWSTDSSGNFLSNLTGAVSGTSSAFEAFEAVFHQDLNGDGINGVVGSPALVTVEAMGSTSLVTLGNGYSLNSNATGTGPELKYGGASVVVGQAAPWSPVGAEQTAGGYDVAWHQAGTDQYSVWSTDSSGNFLSNLTGAVSGTSAFLESYETILHQDLNGDGVTGIPGGTVVEASGSTSLVVTGSNYFLDGSSAGPALKYGGAAVVVGQAAPWSPIGAEQTAGGYDVAWYQAGADQYSVWSTDSSGNFVSNLTGAVSGTSAAFESYETIFHQDLNGDAVIGVPTGQSGLAQMAAVTIASNDTFIFPANADMNVAVARSQQPEPQTSQSPPSFLAPDPHDTAIYPDAHDSASMINLHLFDPHSGFIVG